MGFNPRRIQDIELDRFKLNPIAVENYKAGKNMLRESGLPDFLRLFNRPFLYDQGANINIAASTAAFCEGYNKCLDDIMYFEEMYLTEEKAKKDLVPMFGALERAKAKGDLTEKDLEILNGKRK
jgi:hypothetical protein